MAKRSSIGSRVSTFWKIFSPSYYLRKPYRLAILCLFFVVVLLVGVDRQNSIREREALTSKLQELEIEREKLESVLTKSQQILGDSDASLAGALDNSVDPDSKGLRGSTKQEPLILGVTSQSDRTSTRKAERERDAASRKARKMLPEERVKPLEVNHQKKKKSSFDGDHSTSNGDSTEKEASQKDPEFLKNEQRREAIRWGMIHAWGAYEQYAWGFDELQPQSKRGVNQFGGLGATIVDSLDTLYIMGLKEQFDKAKKWVTENMDFNKSYDCSVFETTIRVLGGLLSAYDLSGDDVFLHKATELAERLLPAWKTPTGIPWSYLNLATGHGYNAGWTGGSSILADIGTTTLEMIGLSQRTGDPKYGKTAENVIKQLDKIFPEDGLIPLYISPDNGHATTGKVSFGAMGDSFFEYLIKVWVQGGKTKPVQHYREMWERSIHGMTTKLIKKSSPSGFTYVAEQINGQTVDKMDHLACFVPGMLVLGAEGPHEEEYVELAKKLTRTCYEFYRSMPSKLSGEHYLFHEGSDLSVGHAYNILRPETVESLMYLWRKTKDPIYREWGWQIWQAFEKHCRLPSGYTGLQDVNQNPPVKDDMMQSFFLAETLKYLYLLFSPDDVIPLDEWVFNTEAHPIKIISRAGEGQDSSVGLGNESEKPKEVFNDDA